MDLYNWALKHWVEILSFLGIGAGSAAGGLGAKKLVDKKQDGRIANLAKKVNSMDKDLEKVNAELVSLKSDIKVNTELDKQFRTQMSEQYAGLKSDVGGVTSRLDRLLEHLIKP